MEGSWSVDSQTETAERWPRASMEEPPIGVERHSVGAAPLSGHSCFIRPARVNLLPSRTGFIARCKERRMSQFCRWSEEFARDFRQLSEERHPRRGWSFV